MIITDITAGQKHKDRYNIFVDGEFKFSLSAETVLKYRLKKGYVLTEDLVREISLESEKVLALAKAISYVSKTLKTKKQVKEYLRLKGFSENVVYEVIEKLVEYNYINDAEYAKRYLESCAESQGKKLVQYKLMAKGISKDNIQFAFDNVDIPLKENAKKLAEKRLKNKEITRELLAKTYKYLLSKGFSYDEVEYAIQEYKGDFNG